MRISIFLNNDLESNIALNCLLPEVSKFPFNFYLSERVGASKQELPALQYLDFLEREFVTTKLFPKLEREFTGAFLSFNQISEKYGAPLHLVSEVKSETTLSTIEAFSPDLFISIRFGKIFKGKVLSIPPLGIINLHSAILPDYKGVLGTFRALMDGKQKIGSTLHYISDSSIDTGAILNINQMNAHHDKTVLWHVINLYPQAVSTLNNMVEQLANGSQLVSSPQPKGGNYYSFPDEKDFESLKKRGFPIYNLAEYAQLLSDYYKVDKEWVLAQMRDSGLPNSF